MKTNIVLGLAALTLGLVAVKSFTPVLAYQGDPAVKGPNYTEERHDSMLQAFQNKNYQSWADLMDGRGATRFVNADNFSEFAAAHLDAEKGDYTKLNEFKTKYGMGQGQGKGQGRGMGYRSSN
ncbi:hypothetical protein A2574_02510 [Candidatus Shapirobacteria bacterium RIFOXYD1_FULL_38_32]|uniref:Uncharacterized protein n=2 Tax=Candidatus Shapironibacteriota TaxID=1752721 RepID=A0A0G0JNN9_9BACT|nr:MAG: hypothetical protein US90_C0024G0003 [Candidatus Shapirobacteria bacterium GW2011_GWE2_38_30]KKQ91355.1 MAG: hypothetical protein UT14_C0014G0006 [Candidatus Shapirobacteria bacterium GW2011_GWE1_38_92]OGL56024.1 MAG: hypothetical protein A2195_01610 [Candidatus Shapirobacteria bacterium RIFOXYA1_FULL_39_17]OGL56455.1 MAG: hypothetical protein A2410_03720 [Candidatus Shapirobacteria bacterium RIFOXYC1_FULL_38_24]OGL58507.1 MAG: hypothetical protein A2574_02510 [Candidatus Shapirobacteri